jgi:hypothetical protein
MEKVQVIINEQHKLTAEQETLLNNRFDKWELYKVPAEGWTIAEMNNRMFDLTTAKCVFVSPIPYMLKILTSINYKNIYIFHNDKREKVELPNGKVIYKVADTGWQIV